MFLEEVVTLQLKEAIGELAFSPHQHLSDRDPSVVIADAARHRSEEPEGPHVTFPETLGAFPLEDLEVKGVAAGQAHDEEGALLQGSVEVDQGMAEIDLSLAWRMA